MTPNLLPDLRRLLHLRPAPRPQQIVPLEVAERALYDVAEPVFAGVDAVEYAQRVLTHPSQVLRDHALARLKRQRDALTRAYVTAHRALGVAIEAVERSL